MVERYNVDVEKNDNGYWEGVLFISSNGDWVHHSDYAALERQIAELRAENEKLHTHNVAGFDEEQALRKAAEADKARLSEALRHVVDLVDRDVIRVRPSDRDEFLSALATWNAALSGSGAGGWRELRDAFEAARYQPGDYPIVSVKIDRFMKIVERLLAAPTGEAS